jgi:thioredoxin reductase (NADPH)
MKDIIIVGGGCAGLTAALYGARAGKSVLLFESESIGGQIATAPQIDNYPGIPHVSGMQFADSLYDQVIAQGVEIDFDRVIAVENGPNSKIVVTESDRYECGSVILATGSKHRLLGLPREKDLIGHGISYCAICDGAFYKNCPVAVIGGGNTAICDALFLSNLCSSVTIIHRRDEFRADAALLAQAKTTANIHFITGATVEELLGTDNLSAVTLRMKEDNTIREFPTEALFVAIGQVPNSSCFSDLIQTDSGGYLVAGEDCRTNVPGIFAAGDCRSKVVRQLTTAASDGAIAASGAGICPV